MFAHLSATLKRHTIAPSVFIAISYSSCACAGDYAKGGYAGAVDAILSEAVKNGHLDQSVKDDILPGYEEGQRLLGEAFHSNGVTATRAISQASGLAGGVQKAVTAGAQNMGTSSPEADEIPRKTLDTYTLPADSDTLVAPLQVGGDADLIRATFEKNNCVATETQLFEAISAGSDIWAANQAIVSWSSAPDFKSNYEIIDREPFTYRLKTGAVCGDTAAPANAGMPLSKAAQWLVDDAILHACQDRGGTMDPQGVTVRDLDNDGKDDLILMHEWISCRGPSEMPITCGAKVCTGAIYLRRGNLLKEIGSFNGGGLSVGNGTPPVIEFHDHVLKTVRLGWDGRRFSSR